MSNLKNYARAELERAKMFSQDGDFYGDVRQSPTRVKLWEGEISFIPRDGEMVVIHADYGMASVRHVHYDLPANEVEIHVWVNSEYEFPVID